VLRPLVGANSCPVTTTELRLPLAVSFARRFLTSFSACCWVTNNPKRSSPAPTDQPYSVCSTRKVIAAVCLAMGCGLLSHGPAYHDWCQSANCRQGWVRWHDIRNRFSGHYHGRSERFLHTHARRLRMHRHVDITLLSGQKRVA
jgi:hypothetical protein